MFPHKDVVWLLDNGDAGYTMPMIFSFRGFRGLLATTFLVLLLQLSLDTDSDLWSEKLRIHRQALSGAGGIEALEARLRVTHEFSDTRTLAYR